MVKKFLFRVFETCTAMAVPNTIPIQKGVKYLMTASVVYWSEILATDPEIRVRFPALPTI
jgi:hypothetical protein